MIANLYCDGVEFTLMDPDEKGFAVEVEPERVDRWRKAQEEWEAVQEDMSDAMQNSRVE
ncbi:hypothetical protein SEA_KENREY_172 [Streptomyces phage Kenrey]|nr:hypothetical protein SEA_KENREY_172 [Streptomyces phage Kenrey]